jgi:redox-sensitive bicupin YhaK (pirin superfamily)
VEYKLGAKRHAYLVPAAGTVEVNGVKAGPRDGVAIEQEEKVIVTALEDAEIVLVDSA